MQRYRVGVEFTVRAIVRVCSTNRNFIFNATGVELATTAHALECATIRSLVGTIGAWVQIPGFLVNRIEMEVCLQLMIKTTQWVFKIVTNSRFLMEGRGSYVIMESNFIVNEWL